MGSGDKGHIHMPHLHFHLHNNHGHGHHGVGGGGSSGRKSNNNIPKGCVAIMVGQQGAEQQRFVIPVMYVNHPLFTQLLKEAEEEYGFDHKGPINIPCHVEEFCHIRGIIAKETMSSNPDHHHHHGHHHHHQFLCFRA